MKAMIEIMREAQRVTVSKGQGRGSWAVEAKGRTEDDRESNDASPQ